MVWTALVSGILSAIRALDAATGNWVNNRSHFSLAV